MDFALGIIVGFLLSLLVISKSPNKKIESKIMLTPTVHIIHKKGISDTTYIYHENN